VWISAREVQIDKTSTWIKQAAVDEVRQLEPLYTQLQHDMTPTVRV